MTDAEKQALQWRGWVKKTCWKSPEDEAKAREACKREGLKLDGVDEALEPDSKPTEVDCGRCHRNADFDAPCWNCGWKN